MDAKTRAANAALNHIENGMIVGLGSGSTATIFIDLLGQAIASGRFTGIRGVPTSIKSHEQAIRLNIPLLTLAQAGGCDVTVDGADEVDPNLDLIKGLGGALLREKIVAENTRKMVVIVDESKIVSALGERCPLPVEVTQFAYDVNQTYLRQLGCDPVQRLDEQGNKFVSDNGNYYFHCNFGQIKDPAGLNSKLKSRAGIIETGLFLGCAKIAIVAGSEGVRELHRR